MKTVLLLCLGVWLCANCVRAQTSFTPTPANPQAQACRLHALALLGKSDYSPAIPLARQAYALDKTAHPDDAAIDLTLLGRCYDGLSRYSESLDCYRQARGLMQKVGNSMGEAVTLSNIGGIYQNLGRYSDALDCFQQALSLAHRLKEKKIEAATRNNIGSLYSSLGRYADALDIYRQTLPLEQQLKDKPSEAILWNNIGGIEKKMSRYVEALDSLQKALNIERQRGDSKADEAQTLATIGTVYDDLNQPLQAVNYDRQAMQIDRQIGDKKDEAALWNNAGAISEEIADGSDALDFYARALRLEEQIGDVPGAATTLDNIGVVYDEIKQYPKALDFHRRALFLEQQLGDPVDTAIIWSSMGLVYEHMGRLRDAVTLYGQALPIQQVGDIAGAARTLNNIMAAYRSLGQPNIAIFYGKQAVNAFQSIRTNIRTMDPESRKSYLEANASTYRMLADLLISQGRLTEAQQVLRMLKEREFYDFLNPDPNAPPPAVDRIVLTKREADWTMAYDKAAQPLTDLGAEEQRLRVKKSRTPAEAAQLAHLQTQIGQTTTALSTVQQQIATAFSSPPTADDAPPQTTGAGELQRALPTGTAALYTIVAPDKINLILIMPGDGKPKAFAVPITAAALYQKVLALRRALTDPNTDPTGPAADLYHLMLEPVQKDLDAAGTNVILFSLDDALRYVPPAALYNPQTKQYVAERYRTELITLAGTPPTAPAPAALSVLGLGVSTSQDGAPALPGVAAELAAIVHEPQDTGGLLPGKRLLDAQFTQAALEDGLKTRGYPLVHLASHFALHGTQDTSYLLLGDSSHLSVAALAEDPHRFRGVELLTLSACQTAMEVRGSGGREVEGIGALAQTLGAGSVLASLWPVSDAATPVLMTALYGYRQQHPAASWAEALQAAQLSLLHMPLPAAADSAKRGTEPVANQSDSTVLPPFIPDSKAPYAHPFYWAPFILIGHWR